jgi:hypothetical protein
MSMLALTNSGDVRNLRCSPEGLLRVAFAPPIEALYDIGAVAANATVLTTPIDLGVAESRQHTLVLAIKRGVASSGEVFSVESSLDGTDWVTTHNASGSTASAWHNGSGSFMYNQARPFGRYVRLRYQNGSTAQTALKLNLTAIAGV